MKQEFTQEKIYCDCCGREISRPLFYRNDGSFQENHIEKNGKDICLSCSALILSELKVDEEKLNEALDSVKNRYYKHNTFKIELPSIFEK